MNNRSRLICRASKQRVLALWNEGNKSPREIAEELGISLSTVKYWIHLCRKKD